MDPYKDPDEFIKNLGAEEFERRIGNARNGFMFGLEMLEKEYDMNSPEGKTAFFQEAARRLIGFEDELERNNYIEAVAGTYRATVESLQKLVAKMAVREGMAKPGGASEAGHRQREAERRRGEDFPENSAYLDDRGQKTVWNHSEVYQSGRFSGTSVPYSGRIFISPV